MCMKWLLIICHVNSIEQWWSVSTVIARCYLHLRWYFWSKKDKKNMRKISQDLLKSIAHLKNKHEIKHFSKSKGGKSLGLLYLHWSLQDLDFSPISFGKRVAEKVSVWAEHSVGACCVVICINLLSTLVGILEFPNLVKLPKFTFNSKKECSTYYEIKSKHIFYLKYF